MRIARVVAGSAAVITAVLGLSLATAGPAAATDTGSWRAYGNTNPISSSSSTWGCSGSKMIDINVFAQACTIRGRDRLSIQSAMIVRNDRSGLFVAEAEIAMFTNTLAFVDDWACSSSGIAAHSWSVCFGRTLREISPVPVNTDGTVNGWFVGISPDV